METEMAVDEGKNEIDSAYRLEREFWKITLEWLEMEGNHMTITEFGSLVFSEISDGKRAYYAAQGKSAAKGPRRINLADAYRAAKVLGKPLATLILIAEDRIGNN